MHGAQLSAAIYGYTGFIHLYDTMLRTYNKKSESRKEFTDRLFNASVSPIDEIVVQESLPAIVPARNLASAPSRATAPSSRQREGQVRLANRAGAA